MKSLDSAVQAFDVLRSISLEDVDKQINKLEDELLTWKTLRAVRALLNKEYDVPSLATDLDKTEVVIDDPELIDDPEWDEWAKEHRSLVRHQTKKVSRKGFETDQMVEDYIKRNPMKTIMEISDGLDMSFQLVSGSINRNQRFYTRVVEMDDGGIPRKRWRWNSDPMAEDRGDSHTA
jgi:hypothetical protein